MDSEVWEQAGLYDPDAPAAADRRALLAYLTERGASLDELVEAHQQGALPGLAGALVIGGTAPSITLDELAARCGVSVDHAQRVLLALGIPVAANDVLSDDLAELIAAFDRGAALMGDEAILAFTRVLGAAATNIAEAAVALFYAELGPGTAREGTDELTRAQMAEMATLAFTSVPDVLSRALFAQFERASRRATQTRGWSTGDDVVAVGPREVVALGFVDLVDSTGWAERMSLRDQSLALSRFESAAWSTAVLAQGRVVKMIGDEVFFTAPTADAACRIGVELCRVAESDPMLPPARAAVGLGAVTPREGDYFGPLVNLVSRLVKVPEPGGLVATEEAAAALPTHGWVLNRLGPLALRGLDQPVRPFAVALAATDDP